MNPSMTTMSSSIIPGVAEQSTSRQRPSTSTNISCLPLTLTLHVSASYCPQGGGLCVIGHLSSMSISRAGLGSQCISVASLENAIEQLYKSVPKGLRQQSTAIKFPSLKVDRIDSDDAAYVLAIAQALNMAISTARIFSTRPAHVASEGSNLEFQLESVLVLAPSRIAVDVINYNLREPASCNTIPATTVDKKVPCVQRAMAHARQLQSKHICLSIDMADPDNTTQVQALHLAKQKCTQAVKHYCDRAGLATQSIDNATEVEDIEARFWKTEMESRDKMRKKREARRAKKLRQTPLKETANAELGRGLTNTTKKEGEKRVDKETRIARLGNRKLKRLLRSQKLGVLGTTLSVSAQAVPGKEDTETQANWTIERLRAIEKLSAEPSMWQTGYEQWLPEAFGTRASDWRIGVGLELAEDDMDSDTDGDDDGCGELNIDMAIGRQDDFSIPNTHGLQCGDELWMYEGGLHMEDSHEIPEALRGVASMTIGAQSEVDSVPEALDKAV